MTQSNIATPAIRIESASDVVPQSLPKDLGFGRYFTNRMFTQRYSADLGWHDAAIIPYGPLRWIRRPRYSKRANGIRGTKAYRRPDGNLNLFRVERNAERFNRSAVRMGMPAVDERLHLQAITELVRLEQRWVPDQQARRCISGR